MSQDNTDPQWQSTRRRIAIRSFQFMLGAASFLLLYGLFYPGGIERLEAMKEIIYTIGGTFSLLVTGYMGLDIVSRIRGSKKSKVADESKGE